MYVRCAIYISVPVPVPHTCCLPKPNLSCIPQVANLGDGGFAKVSHCKLMLDSEELDCAVKMLKPELFSHRQDVEMFIREGVTLKRIHHPCAP